MGLTERLAKLEQTRAGREKLIIVRWIRDSADDELTRLSRGGQKWTRRESESHSDFIARAKVEVESAPRGVTVLFGE